MATWPVSIPQDLTTDGFSLTQQDQTIRTEMSAGPVFVRRRFTAAATPFGGSIVVDAAQFTTLMDFFNNTLGGGVDSFDWTHPVTGSAATVRFTGVPATSAAGGGWYRIAVQFEVMP